MNLPNSLTPFARLKFLLLLLAVSATSAWANLLVYEGYSYAEEADLAGLDGGHGFAGPWTEQTSMDGTLTAGLALGDLAVAGQALELSRVGDHSLNRFVARELAASAPEGATLYMSYLSRLIVDNGGDGHELRVGVGTYVDEDDDQMQFHTQAFSVNLSERHAIGYGKDSFEPTENAKSVLDQTQFTVARWSNLGSPDQEAKIWIFDSAEAVNAVLMAQGEDVLDAHAIDTATITGGPAALMAGDYLKIGGFIGGGAGEYQVVIDEIRLGTSAESVTPRPVSGLLVYEGFGYGEAMDLAGLNGGHGFADAWTDQESMDGMLTEGLSLGDLAVSGQAAELARVGNHNRNAFAARQLAASAPAGTTLYMSYLSRLIVDNGGDGHEFRVGVGTFAVEDDDQMQFHTQAFSVNLSERHAIGYGKDAFEPTENAKSVLDQTQFTVARWNNLGAVDQEAKIWIFDSAESVNAVLQAQSEDALDAHAIDTTTITGGPAALLAGDYVKLGGFIGGGAGEYRVIFDELRIGTSAEDVTPGPASGLLVYEGFGYPGAEDLDGLAGGHGFAGPWIDNENMDGTLVDGLSLGNLATAGDAVEFARVGDHSRNRFAVRELAASAPAGTTLYMSYLTQFSFDNGGDGHEFRVAVGTYLDENDDQMQFHTQAFSVNLSERHAIGYGKDAFEPTENAKSVLDQTQFTVARWSNTGSTEQEAKIWIFDSAEAVNAVLNAQSEETLDAHAIDSTTITGGPAALLSGDFLKLGGFIGGAGGEYRVIFDELRVATSLAEVTPSPVYGLVAYEGYNYEGDDLAGQDGGFGFADAWLENTAMDGTLTDGLSLGGLATSGGAVEFARVGDHSRNRFAAREVATAVPAGSWLYMSYLTQFSFDNGGDGHEFRVAMGTFLDENDDQMQFHTRAFSVNLSERHAIGYGKDSFEPTPNAKSVVDQTQFTVARWSNLGSPDQEAKIWIFDSAAAVDAILNATDESVLDANAIDATTIIGGPAAFLSGDFLKFGGFIGGAGGEYRVIFDELRLGTDLLSVVPSDGLPPERFANIVEASVVGGNLVASPWFGRFYFTSNGWLDHEQLGQLYADAVMDADSMWLYSSILDSWIWTSQEAFAAVYEWERQRWVYYVLVTEGVWLYDFDAETWELIEG